MQIICFREKAILQQDVCAVYRLEENVISVVNIVIQIIVFRCVYNFIYIGIYIVHDESVLVNNHGTFKKNVFRILI